MRQRSFFAAGAALSTFVLVGCSSSPALLPPTAPQTDISNGVTLKVGPPTPVSPASNSTAGRTPTLTLRSSQGVDGTSTLVSYEFQVQTTGGQVLYTGTAFGGVANGQTVVSHSVTTTLPASNTLRWRARARAGSSAGPWSDAGTAQFEVSTLGPESSNDEFRDYFFATIASRGVGGVPTSQIISTLEPDLTGVGIILAKDAAANPRGRLYLPTGNPNDKYARSVDVVTGFGPGSSWTWLFRGRTVCEFICP